MKKKRLIFFSSFSSSSDSTRKKKIFRVEDTTTIETFSSFFFFLIKNKISLFIYLFLKDCDIIHSYSCFNLCAELSFFFCFKLIFRQRHLFFLLYFYVK